MAESAKVAASSAVALVSETASGAAAVLSVALGAVVLRVYYSGVVVRSGVSAIAFPFVGGIWK